MKRASQEPETRCRSQKCQVVGFSSIFLRRVAMAYRPMQNGHVESFHGKLRPFSRQRLPASRNSLHCRVEKL